MRHHLGIVRKEVDHSRSAASADLAEARACRELLSGDEDLAMSNKEITCGLHAHV